VNFQPARPMTLYHLPGYLCMLHSPHRQGKKTLSQRYLRQKPCFAASCPGKTPFGRQTNTEGTHRQQGWLPDPWCPGVYPVSGHNFCTKHDTRYVAYRA